MQRLGWNGFFQDPDVKFQMVLLAITVFITIGLFMVSSGAKVLLK